MDLPVIFACLSERERAITYMIVQGLPNKNMATTLGLSLRTIETHRARVFAAFDVESPAQLCCKLALAYANVNLLTVIRRKGVPPDPQGQTS